MRNLKLIINRISVNLFIFFLIFCFIYGLLSIIITFNVLIFFNFHIFSLRKLSPKPYCKPKINQIKLFFLKKIKLIIKKFINNNLRINKLFLKFLHSLFFIFIKFNFLGNYFIIITFKSDLNSIKL